MKKHTKLNHSSLLASTDVKLLYRAIKTSKCCSLSISIPVIDLSTVFGPGRLWEQHFEKRWVMKPNCLAGKKVLIPLTKSSEKQHSHCSLHLCWRGHMKRQLSSKDCLRRLFLYLYWAVKMDFPTHFDHRVENTDSQHLRDKGIALGRLWIMLIRVPTPEPLIQ